MIKTFLAKDYPHTGNKFSGPDKLELYNKNLLSQSVDWYYRNNSITYTVNSQGYRCPEFDKIDWANSIVILGCSYVYGIGIDDSNTIDKELSKLTNCPVINLGAGGTSIEFSLYNSIILRKLYPKPKAIVQIWTGINRYTIFNNDNKTMNQGSWNFTIDDKYNTNINLSMHGYLNTIASKQIYRDTTYYTASYFTETCDIINCDSLHVIDYARDLLHPGIETNKQTAIKIYENIK